MGKRILQLYADDEDIAVARAKGMNISFLFREFLKLELYQEEIKGNSEKVQIQKLKLKLTKLSQELELKTKENKKLKETDKKDKTILWR